MKQEMELITISRMKAARKCPRFHYYSYELGRRPIQTSEALYFGTLFHTGLEQWWLAYEEEDVGCNGLKPLEIALSAMQAKYFGSQDESEATVFDFIKADELMRGYHARWFDDMRSVKVLGVESQFEMPMFNPRTGRPSKTYKLAGKIDARVMLADETCRIVEHKTSTEDISPGSTYWLRLRMDGQVSQYIDGARHLGDDVRGCIYDVARRPTMKPKIATPEEDRVYIKKASKLKDGTVRPAGSLRANQREADETPEEFRLRVREHIAERPEEYFQRGDIVRLEKELNDFRSDTWTLAKVMRNAQRESAQFNKEAWNRNYDSCFKWGRACEYYDVCDNAADIDDNELFRTSEKHSELDSKEENS